MRKLLQNLFAFAVILLISTACQKSTKEQLIGTWHYTSIEESDGIKYTFDGTDTIEKDGTFSSSATAVYSTTQDVDGTDIQIKVGMSFAWNGEWVLNDKDIVESPTSIDVKITSVKYYDPSDGSFLAALTGNDLIEYEKELDLESMKKKFFEASTEHIIMLQENKFVTESTDDDGKKSTQTYNRVR